MAISISLCVYNPRDNNCKKENCLNKLTIKSVLEGRGISFLYIGVLLHIFSTALYTNIQTLLLTNKNIIKNRNITMFAISLWAHASRILS